MQYLNKNIRTIIFKMWLKSRVSEILALYVRVGDISENGQRDNPNFKTVGYLNNRYRLVHFWVPEMVLNV
jgi:hypothetical protein